jgi:hypothetical protein
MNKKITARLNQAMVAGVCSIMLLNTNAWTVNMLVEAAFGASAYASEEDDKLLKKLRDKHRLDDPYRHNRSEQRYEAITRPSRDLTDSLEQSIISSRERDGTVNFDVFDLETLSIADGLDDARTVASTASGPRMDENNQIEMSVASEPVLEMYRDEETGELRYRQTEGASASNRRTMTVGGTEVFSTELEHEDTEWEGEDTYNDEDAFLQAGRDSNERLRANSTQTGESVAYKTIISSAERGANETVPEAILQPGFDYIETATAPGGDVFGNCSTITQTETSGLYKPNLQERYCQEMNSDNPFFCEIRREVNSEGFVGSSNFTSCGPGCFKYNHSTPSYRTSSSCRSTWADQAPDIQTQNSTLRVMIDQAKADGITLESVKVRFIDTHDHFMITMNGHELMYNIGTEMQMGSNTPAVRNGLPWFDSFFSSTGGGGDCNIANHDFKTSWIDVTDRALSIIEQTGDFVGIQDLAFQTDLAYSSYGKMDLDIQLQFSDELAIVEETITQFPEGCLDQAKYIGDEGSTGGQTTCGLVCPSQKTFTVSDASQPGGTATCSGALVDARPDEGICQYEGAGALACEGQYAYADPVEACSTAPGDGLDHPDFDGWCTFTDYEVIDEGRKNLPDVILNQLGPLYPGDQGNVTWRVNLTDYTCDPFQGGEYCVDVPTDVPGEYEEVCQTWEDIQEGGGTCGVYEDNANCKEVERECVEDWEFEEWDNYCFNETVTYECDEGADLTFSYETTKNSCDSMLPCTGGDCDWDNDESNDRFLEAVAMGNVAEHIQGNQSCEDPMDPSTCRIFEGERGYCSWALASDWGADCCEAPEGVDFLTYLNASMQLMRFENKQLGGVFSEPAKEAVSGAWKTMKEPIQEGVTSAWSKLSSPFTSIAESTTGTQSASVVSGGVESQVAESGMGPVMQAVSQYIYDALPEAYGEMIFSTSVAADGSNQVTGLSEGMQSAADFMGQVMFWYSMYQLAQLVTDLYFACDETDNETALKMEMRQCYAEGDKYCSKKALGVCTQRRQDQCCYPSMLGRIVMEQAQGILGKDMSQCHGLTHDELATLDFSQIDLSEWIGTLIEADMLPENTEEALTGKDRMVNKEGRETVSERTKGRAEDMSDAAESIKRDMREPLDCSIYPRPPICDFGFKVEGN